MDQAGVNRGVAEARRRARKVRVARFLALALRALAPSPTERCEGGEAWEQRPAMHDGDAGASPAARHMLRQVAPLRCQRL